MPTRFEKYRVKDGVTHLGERFLNAVFKDIDLRLVGLEDLRLSWEEAIRAVSDYGLVRINDVLGPALTDVTEKSAEIESKRQIAEVALTNLELIVAGIKSDTVTDIEAWKASLTAELPGIDSRLNDLESGKADTLAMAAALADKADTLAMAAALADKAEQSALAATIASLPILVNPNDLGNFTIPPGVINGQLAVVKGYGLYYYDSASAEAADGETIVHPSAGSGRWYLAAPHWDFSWSYLSGLFDTLHVDIQKALDAAAAKVAASKLLTGSAVLDFGSISGGASALLTITVMGAETTDRVVLTPPSVLPNGVIPIAYVSAANTVAVRLNNVTISPIDPADMTYIVTVIKP